MNNSDFEEEINLINNNKLNFMNDLNYHSQNIIKENFGPIENSNNHKVKEIKFIKQ